MNKSRFSSMWIKLLPNFKCSLLKMTHGMSQKQFILNGGFKTNLKYRLSFIWKPHQWPFKSGRLEVLGSIPCRCYRPNCCEFFVIFSPTHVNTSQNSLERSLGGHPPYSPRPLMQVIVLILKHQTPFVWKPFECRFPNTWIRLPANFKYLQSC